MKIGEMIKAARDRAGLTLTELGERVKVSKSVLSEIENDQKKNPLAPSQLVAISDALGDVTLLGEFCDACAIRCRIIPKKFPPLNNIHQNAHVSVMKVVGKLSEAGEKLQNMLTRMLRKDFRDDPEFTTYRDEAIILVLDLKRGTEILLEQLQAEGVVTPEHLQMLREVQQRLCVQKGHHIEAEA